MADFQRITVGVIGAGTMGSGIAQVAAQAGHDVLIYDADPAMTERARNSHSTTFARLVEKGKISAADATTFQAAIRYAKTPGELEGCGLVIEAIIENLDIKQKLFNDMEKIVDAGCVLATNTSSLSVTSIASVCNDPSRVVGIHFFNPAPLMPLVEIVGGIASNQEVLQEMKKLVAGWGKVPVMAKDTPGFIVNRIARPYYGEAIRISEEGIADFATIDWAMKQYGFRMGPFELMDLIGNDVNYTVTETVWTQMFYDPRYKPSLTQRRLFEARRFGKKSGQGYYNYSGSAPAPSPIQDAALGEKIFRRIIAMLINEAVDALYYRIATRDDIDLAMTKGVNYPKGLLAWCDELGAGDVLKQMESLRELYSEDRYRPSVLLKEMARSGKKFYESMQHAG